MEQHNSIGYVLILSIPGAEHTIYSELKDMAEVIGSHPMFGEFDIMAQVEGKNPRDIAETVSKIRTIDGVLNTKTLTGIKF